MTALCRHVLIRSAWGAETSRGLLAYAWENRDRFQPGKIVTRTETLIQPDVFAALNLHRLGDVGRAFEKRLLAMAPRLTEELHLPPFQPQGVETTIGAYGHGHFYKTHSDVLVGESAQGKPVRVITACYYFHAHPRRFEGGAFRLHGFAPPGEQAPWTDILPEDDCLVAFPSMARHEALPTHCPGVDFPGWRFVLIMRLLRAAAC